MHVTNKQFSDKFDNGWKKIKIGRFILRELFDLMGAITRQVPHVSFPNVLCMHVTNDQISSEFNNGWKIQNGRFIVIFRILHQ